LARYSHITPGKIVGEEYYYDLVANDIKGRKWEERRVDPNITSGPAGSIAHGRIN
jgi:hypothetical protein